MGIIQSTLGNKHNTVYYHVVDEVAEARILRVGKEDTEANLADLLTNILGWQRHHKLPPFVLYSI